jgi:predicted RNase H-like HicB family nuclease
MSASIQPLTVNARDEWMTERLTAIKQREGDGYVALCPELDIASQGDSVEQARGNVS